MSDNDQFNAAVDPAFFRGRLLIDILSWDWTLRVALNPSATRPKVRFQGLDVSRDFTILGRIRAPTELRGRSIKVTLSPFGSRVRFGRGGVRDVGRLSAPPPMTDLEAALMLPESEIATTATSLASVWKYLQILTFDEVAEGAKVSAYFFGAVIPPNLRAWADAE